MPTPAPIFLPTTPAEGVTVQITADDGGLSGYELLGTFSGPLCTVEISYDGLGWSPVDQPLVLTGGLLRFKRPTVSQELTTLHALAPDGAGGGGGGGSIVLGPDGLLSSGPGTEQWAGRELSMMLASIGTGVLNGGGAVESRVGTQTTDTAIAYLMVSLAPGMLPMAIGGITLTGAVAGAVAINPGGYHERRNLESGLLLQQVAGNATYLTALAPLDFRPGVPLEVRFMDGPVTLKTVTLASQNISQFNSYRSPGLTVEAYNADGELLDVVPGIRLEGAERNVRGALDPLGMRVVAAPSDLNAGGGFEIVDSGSGVPRLRYRRADGTEFFWDGVAAG